MAISETPGKMYALAVLLSVLATVAVILRFHSRRLLKTTRIEIDDYMILPALLFTLGTGLCMVVGAALGDLGRHTVQDADGMPVFSHRTQIFLQVNFASVLIQTLTFGFTKLAVLLFYKRIFTNGRVVYAIWTMITVVNIWIIAFFLSNLLQCFPISVNWTDWGVILYQCVDTNAIIVAQAWSDVITDVLILSIPLPCIWRLQMPTLQKIAVCSIFLLGTLVVAAGVAKLVVFQNIIAGTVQTRVLERPEHGLIGFHFLETQGDNNDVTYILTPLVYWSMVESSLGVVGACLPSMRPLFRDFSFEGFIRSTRILRAIPTGRWCRSSVMSEKVNDALSKQSTRYVCSKCSNNIKMDHDFIAPKSDIKVISAIHNFDKLDDLPDFASLADSGCSDMSRIWANNMV